MLKNTTTIQSQRNTMTKRFKKLSVLQIMFVCFLALQCFAFADFSNLGNQVQRELKSTAATVMSVLNTVIASVGIIYVIIVGFIFIFKPDTFKENAKVLIGALVALGALYGITHMGMSAFL
ncbi:hypothetical protein CQA53_05660 [Helicobacter didelphidarum]|uniref:Uncharacterized protein n=2 Tax=Helicobacter didelphidarum TaxID=2040648 RepID=A0A3D8IKP2_9HELI|nr:hypothetical protein CQA53_05660 [Helicobacter didelphidarum]